MAGAWEMLEANRVLCAILHVDNTSIAWALGFRNLKIPGPVSVLSGMPYDHARNQACQQALGGGFQYLFFLDSDVIPPADAVHRLLARNLPIVSGMYCRRSPPHAIPVMLRGGQWVTRLPDLNNPNESPLVEVDLVGAGCMLVHRSVLEKFLTKPGRPGKPWFDWRVDMQGIMPAGECLSEDFTFNLRARTEFGYKIVVDTSVRCRHVGLAQADYNSFLPCEATPNT